MPSTTPRPPPTENLPEILTATTKDGIKFGKELRRKDFMFDEKYRNLNHGSFGTYPRSVRDALRSFQDQAEARPDDFIRYKYPHLLDESREAIAKILNAPTPEIVFVPNATTGVNTILRSLVYEEGDYILYFAPIYGSCEKTVAYLTETTPVKAVKIEYVHPVEDDYLITIFTQKVEQISASGRGCVKIALFDTVCSNPGVRFPFEKLVAVCKKLNIYSVLDGAHGVGNIELDLRALDADFFVSNCHKWLHTPRGCAVLHIPTRNQPLIRSTLPTSHGFIPHGLTNVVNPLPPSKILKSSFVTAFEFVGTIDNAPYLCIPAAVKFRERLGGEKMVREYCQALAIHGTKRVAEMLGTKVLENEKATLMRCPMVNVLLPLDPHKMEGIAAETGIGKGAVGMEVRNWIAQTLVSEYATFMAPMFYGGRWWVRLSGQVYLEMEDFEWAGSVLREVCGRAERGDWARGKSLL
ncbi:PLP-dependent transferase [Periconia macrospinosa]|uniref:PLP-dependent transferase n=1 Tax=Periconia macrospinosa TaxID=97972 RepID=A0A2V1EE85_9PLEO|nr:PLP-dependent transferase [Periconia macrospinosa]